MDVTMPPETHSEHIARSKQAGLTQSNIITFNFKFSYVIVFHQTVLRKDNVLPFLFAFASIPCSLLQG
jgi:hypothetical protein